MTPENKPKVEWTAKEIFYEFSIAPHQKGNKLFYDADFAVKKEEIEKAMHKIICEHIDERVPVSYIMDLLNEEIGIKPKGGEE